MVKAQAEHDSRLPATLPVHRQTTTALRPAEKVDEDALLGQFIPLQYHGPMLSNAPRMESFIEAIAKRVPIGGQVLELGAGTGVLSYFAAQRAARVICIERIPHVAKAARRFLRANQVHDRVEVLETDARRFVPKGPVDAVICEMLHVGLLREKQVEVIRAFKDRYIRRFGPPMPIFIPEASLLAVQPVHQSFNFHGYEAPLPMFYDPTSTGHPTESLAQPHLYSLIEYAGDIPVQFKVDQVLRIEHDGVFNALRFITKNLVGIFPEEGRSADWFMQYLVMPVPRPFPVKAGEEVRIIFEYSAGDSLDSLGDSIVALQQ